VCLQRIESFGKDGNDKKQNKNTDEGDEKLYQLLLFFEFR